MGELLRRGFDAQLADRNTKDYDLLVGRAGDEVLRKVQVKTARRPSWPVKPSYYDDFPEAFTIYVLLGTEKNHESVRYFIAKNRDVAKYIKRPGTWRFHGTVPKAAVEKSEDKWNDLVPQTMVLHPDAG